MRKSARIEARVRQLTQLIQIPELRVDCEFGSTGLWNGAGHNHSYESVGLPIVLEQRVRHLQAEFDEKASPGNPNKDDDSFWDWVCKEEIEIVRDIQLLA